MQIFVLDVNRAPIGIIESYKYFRWTRRYSLCGAFELKAIATEENIEILKIGNYIWKDDDRECGIIEYLEINDSDKEIITVSGRFVTSVLSWRTIWNTTILDTDLSSAVETLVSQNITTPTDIDRKIDYIDFSSSAPTIPVKTQISYQNLIDTICGLCDALDVGIKTVYDQTTKIFTVQLYQGGVSQAIFSREYENVTDQTYTESYLNYANTALIGGEGEGSDRTFVSIIGGRGQNRREIFVDAKDVRSEDFPGTYTDALLFRGNEKLEELAPVQSFDAVVDYHGSLRYKEDFDVGSLVKVESKKWGVTFDARITEISESYDSTGLSLDITFGKSLLTITQKLKGAF